MPMDSTISCTFNASSASIITKSGVTAMCTTTTKFSKLIVELSNVFFRKCYCLMSIRNWLFPILSKFRWLFAYKFQLSDAAGSNFDSSQFTNGCWQEQCWFSSRQAGNMKSYWPIQSHLPQQKKTTAHLGTLLRQQEQSANITNLRGYNL